jgi:N-carbamoylputrescine amidase
MGKMLKICGIQMACVEDKEKNLQKAVRLAELAAEKGAKIIGFQELFNTHWFPKDIDRGNFALAEPISGQSIQMMRKVAKEKSAVLICPFFEEGVEGVYYNTAAVINADGRVLGGYRKVHIPQIPLWEEKYYFSPGDMGFPVFHTKYAKIGVQICWDNFFPEGARILGLKGAQIIFAPTAAAFASHDRWETVMRAHAITNGLFTFRINRVGSEEKQDFYGKSFCVTPEGELIDRPSGMQEGIVFATIDLRDISTTRREWTFLRDRRPEVYGEVAGLSGQKERRLSKRAVNTRRGKRGFRESRVR